MVVPFGLGRRRCLQEALERMELNVFFTGILSQFTLEKASPDDKLTRESLPRSISSPKPYSLRGCILTKYRNICILCRLVELNKI